MTTLQIRTMTADDLPAGMALKQQAGWNQIEADWVRMLELQPEGGFVAQRAESVVGTVITCRFGPVAWVAMMLVEASVRGQGIGRALMNRSLEALDGAGVRSVRLDATPLGRPLYESLGFVAEATILRHAGRLSPMALDDLETECGGPLVEPGWDDAILACDRAATGADRARLLRRLHSEHPESLRIVRDRGPLTGFLLSRPGVSATQIGPCIADERAGAPLLRDAFRRFAGQEVIVDIPAEHAAARALAEAHGLEVRRELTRMTRGPRVAERLDRIWASSGPELG